VETCHAYIVEVNAPVRACRWRFFIYFDIFWGGIKPPVRGVALTPAAGGFDHPPFVLADAIGCVRVVRS